MRAIAGMARSYRGKSPRHWKRKSPANGGAFSWAGD